MQGHEKEGWKCTIRVRQGNIKDLQIDLLGL
jgi:hypothetical protein